MSKRPILFVTYGAGHVEIVQALLPALEAAGVSYAILALTAAIPSLQAQGCAALKVSDLLPPADRETVLRLGAELSQALWTPTTGIPYLESCAYLGVSYLDLCREHGEPLAAALYRQRGRRSFCPIAFMETVLSALKPLAVVTTCHVRMERAAVIAANRLGIRSVRIDDLFGNTLDADPDGAPLQGALVPKQEWPSQICVMNRWVSTQLGQRGFPAARIHVTGQPAIAAFLARWNRDAPLQVSQPEGAPTPIGIFLPSSLPLLDWQLQLIRGVLACDGSYHFLLKTHPALDRAELLSRVDLDTDRLTVFESSDLQRFFASASLFGGYYSTTGLTARLLGKSFVVMAPAEDPEGLPLISTSQALLASDVTSFRHALQRLRRDPLPSIPDDSPLFCQADACARVVDLLIGWP